MTTRSRTPKSPELKPKGNAMIDLIVILEAIRQVSKDWHYNSKGMTFYGNHLFADRIGEPCADFIDSLKEVCFMGNEKPVPTSKEINDDLSDHLPSTKDESSLIAELNTLLTIGIYTIEDRPKEALKQGETNLLGSIAEHLQRSKGLLHGVTASKT